MGDAIEIETFRTALLERQRELQELSEISAEARGAVELDQASVGRVSRIDAIQRQAMALANERKGRTIRKARPIDAAMAQTRPTRTLIHNWRSTSSTYMACS